MTVLTIHKGEGKHMTKYVYLFKEGNANMRELLGGKGANLAEMTNIGLPVPQGFTVSTEACTRYYEDGQKIGDDILAQIDEALVVACVVGSYPQVTKLEWDAAAAERRRRAGIHVHPHGLRRRQ